MNDEKNTPPARQTNQRQEILDFLVGSLAHPTAEEIFHAVRKKLPNISLATVYRNLAVLEQAGLIEQISYGKDHVRFQRADRPHSHFVCESCDRLINVALSLSELQRSGIEKKYGVAVRRQAIIFSGLCRECFDRL